MTTAACSGELRVLYLTPQDAVVVARKRREHLSEEDIKRRKRMQAHFKQAAGMVGNGHPDACCNVA
jgi:hypothetical protein